MMLAVDLHSRGKKDFDQRFEIRLSVIGMENDDDWLHFKQEQIHDVKLLEQVDWNGSKNWTNIFTSLFCWRSFSNLHLLYCPPHFDWIFWVQICLHQSLLGYCINLRSLVSLFLEHLSWSELGGGVGNSMNPKVVLRNSFWNVWEDPFDYILPDFLNYSKKFSLRYLSLELCTFIFDDFVSDSLSW